MRLILLIPPLLLASCTDDGDGTIITDDFEPGEASEAELREYGNLVERGLPEGARILVACGPWSGMSNFEEPDDTGWISDGASEGRLVVAVMPDGSPDVIYRDAFGSTMTVLEDGGEASFVHASPDGPITISVSYPSTGNAEIYGVVDAENGPRLLWSSVKQQGLSTRVSAFESDCIDYAQTY